MSRPTEYAKLTSSSTPGYAAGCYNENVGVADIDQDGQGEIIGPNDTHYAAAFNDDGSPVRASSIYGQVGGQNKPWARVGLHVDHNVDLRGYANCGTEHRPNLANSPPTIADVNGDGALEIIIVGNIYNCGTDPDTDLYEMPFILNAGSGLNLGTGIEHSFNEQVALDLRGVFRFMEYDSFNGFLLTENVNGDTFTLGAALNLYF